MSSNFSGYAWFALPNSQKLSFINQNAADLLYPNPTAITPYNPFFNQINKGVITFSFNGNASLINPNSSYNKTNPVIDTSFSDAEKSLVRNELFLLSTMINIKFNEINSTADLNFLHRNVTIGGYEKTVWDNSKQVNNAYVVMIDTLNVDSSVSNKSSRWDSIGTKTFLHEMAHAFGFEHPETYRPAEPTNPPFLDKTYDTGLLTVMSYNDAYIGNYGPQTYMPLDIAGLRTIYGDAINQSAKSYIFSIENKSLLVNGDHIFLNALAPNSIFDPSKNTTLNYSSLNNSYSLNADLKYGYIYVKQPQDVKFQEYDVFQNGIYTEPYNQITLSANSVSDGVYNLSIANGTIISNFIASQGNDFIYAPLNSVNIDGGLGSNTTIFTNSSKLYSLLYKSQSLTVTTNNVTDNLTNIQNIQFSDLTLDTTSFTKTAALSHTNIVNLVELYVASFNRAPDSVGLDYWGGRFSDGMSLQDIAKSFFVQPETVAAYPSNMPTSDFVTKVYNNVLSRGPDTGGLNYWVGQLNNGSISKDSFLLAIINGAMAPTGSAVDRQTLANKEAVGEHYAIYQGLNNSTTWAKDVMSGVTDQMSTVTAANAKADGYAAIAANPATSDLVVKLVGVAV